MKLGMDERLKHRLVGLAVIVSIGAIFLPAMVKKSNQRFDKQMTVSVPVPPKPLLPRVVIPEKQAVFKQVQVAKVTLPSIEASRFQTKVAALAAPPVSRLPTVQPLQLKERTRVVMPVKPVILPRVTNKEAVTYGVQLALFSERSNAHALTHLLQHKGYQPKVLVVHNKKGVRYRVVVGQMVEKEQAKQLQKQLASVVRINGFVVPNQGVS